MAFISSLIGPRRPLNVSLAKAWSLLTNPSKCCCELGLLFLAFDFLINVLIIQNVPYTEIDWKAYMQEVEGVLNGTTDYSQLKGDTGPLVYPAGFVWIYTCLYYLTDSGRNVLTGQYIFIFVHLFLTAAVFRLLVRSKNVPGYILGLITVTSYRIHSITVLRLFNDPVAMLLLYVAFNLFTDDRWTSGSIFYSLAVSVKMNVLLFAPALFLVYLAIRGPVGTVQQLTVCATVQLILAFPFLVTNPLSYLMGAFDLGRIFLHQWTVNWRFLPVEVFVHRGFHLFLLIAHLLTVALCAPSWWRMLRAYHNHRSKRGDRYGPIQQLLLLPLFMCNFIGIVFARSLHYQFYVWYYHQLQFLMWSTDLLSIRIKLLLLGILELCWNTYPSTWTSSSLLHCCHLILLFALFLRLGTERRFPPTSEGKRTN